MATKEITNENMRWKPKSRRKKRANRNLARRIMMRKGKVKKGDGKDVHHVGGNALNKKVN